MSTATETTTFTAVAWTTICKLDDILPWSGVSALLGRKQVALIRWGAGDQVFALANFDPFSNAMVISRGIVGDLQGVPFVASPIYKQRFRLSDGVCLDDASVTLATYPVRVADGVVSIQFKG